MLRLPYGPSAWWVEDIDDPAAWAEGLRRFVAEEMPGSLLDAIPAEHSVVVRCTADAREEIGAALERVVPVAPAAFADDVEIAVRYDGPDLAEVADRTGLDVAGVVEAHSAVRYRVGFCGFSPGFAYLLGLDPVLQLPRRDHPRTVVPAGSVAIAAHYTAVYPSATPGGWHLIGTTDATIWDVAATPPARLLPGTPVSFRSI